MSVDWIGLLVGVVVVGPALGWLFGLGNPMGWLGYPPWRVPPAAWDAHRQNRIYTPTDYQRDMTDT